jgi:hypothetical protein
MQSEGIRRQQRGKRSVILTFAFCDFYFALRSARSAFSLNPARQNRLFHQGSQHVPLEAGGIKDIFDRPDFPGRRSGGFFGGSSI